MSFVQADRQATDGAVNVRRIGDDRLMVAVVNGGAGAAIELSEFNASRIFAMLALMLEIPLPKAIGKAIKL